LSVETTGVPQASASRATVGWPRGRRRARTVGPALQRGHFVVGDEAQEAHGLAQAERGRLRLERAFHLARARHEEHGVRALAADVGERAQQRGLIGQGMQALDVDEQRAPPGARRRRTRPLSAERAGTRPPPAG
jgi:hypothetical protein